eukprot:5017212-Prymnesium_polylepis.1
MQCEADSQQQRARTTYSDGTCRSHRYRAASPAAGAWPVAGGHARDRNRPVGPCGVARAARASFGAH